jgi:hypothetical protein
MLKGYQRDNMRTGGGKIKIFPSLGVVWSLASLVEYMGHKLEFRIDTQRLEFKDFNKDEIHRLMPKISSDET